MRKEKRHKLEVLETKFSRSMCKVTGIDRVWMEEVMCRVGVRGEMRDRVQQKVLEVGWTYGVHE